MIVELMGCTGCWRVYDQYAFPPRCACTAKYFRQIGAIKFNILRWFLTSPVHVVKLLIKDLRESYEKRS